MASGAFARKLHDLFPRIPLANDSDLEKEAFLKSFVLHVYCYHQWHHHTHQGQWLNHMQEKNRTTGRTALQWHAAVSGEAGAGDALKMQLIVNNE